MNSFIAFIRHRKFWIHLGLSLLLLTLLLIGTLSWLRSFTSHNQHVTVPDFAGLTIQQLDTFVRNKEVNIQIIDSIYDPEQKKGIVLHQEPEAGEEVKHNRTVYLYVTSQVAPQMQMPKLIDRSERQARLIIETYGLKLGRVSEQAADCNGCVIDQTMGGKTIEPGTPINKGSTVNLVIGRKSNFFNSSGEDTLLNEPMEDPQQP